MISREEMQERMGLGEAKPLVEKKNGTMTFHTDTGDAATTKAAAQAALAARVEKLEQRSRAKAAPAAPAARVSNGAAKRELESARASVESLARVAYDPGVGAEGKRIAKRELAEANRRYESAKAALYGASEGPRTAPSAAKPTPKLSASGEVAQLRAEAHRTRRAMQADPSPQNLRASTDAHERWRDANDRLKAGAR